MSLWHVYSRVAGEWPSSLRPYALQEVIDSPTIGERTRIEHKDSLVNAETTRGQRHFIFAMKEGMFECIASVVSTVGSYGTVDEAIAAGIGAVFGSRPDETKKE